MSAGLQPELPVKNSRSLFQRFLDMVEVVGNKFPAPFILFAMLAVLVLFLSVVFEGSAVTIAGKNGQPTVIKVTSLANAEGFRYILENIVKNFINFPPLGLVIVMMLAMGLAEATGLIGALVRRILTGVPSWAVTATVFFVSIMAHLASDAAMVIMPATAAAIFASMGRNPILGMSVAFAATAAGFSANFVPTGTDALLSGITATAIGNIPQTANSPTHLLINYYFMSSSALILTIVGTIVAEKVIAPRLAGMEIDLSAANSGENTLTPEELKGLKYAGWTALVYLGLILALTIPETGLLRNPTTKALVPSSPLLSGMIPLLFFFFLTTGTAFGLGKGIIRSADDIPKFLMQGLNGAMSFIVTAFAAAQFIAWFNKTNLATVIAVKGASVLQDLNFTGIPLIIAFIIVCAFVDLFMMSGSAKWLFMAPIFVPMFGLLGFQPALTQAAYRIGESCLNGISPLNYYMPVILGIMSKYTKGSEAAGMGTLMATQIPYAFAFLVAWSAWLLVFMFLDLPLGPGASVFIK